MGVLVSNTSAKPRVAVLIDGENFRSELADQVFEHIAKLGVATIRHVYGNSSANNGWRDKAQKHRILIREQMPGKNAADIALAIEAIDILHKGKIDEYCLVTSDSDFAVLADRLREDGVRVTGFGEAKAAKGFQQACDNFVVLRLPSATAAKLPPRLELKAVVPTVTGNGQKDDDAKRLFQEAILCAAKGRRLVPLAEVGGHLPKSKPGDGRLKTRLQAHGFTLVVADNALMVAVPRGLAA
jgi:hypothetical protein